MAWTIKTKNPIASSSIKAKISQQSEVCEIRTPNGHQILVGSPENLVLIWRDAFNNWSLKVKIGS